MNAEELDRRFDNGEDITKYLDLSKTRRPGQELRRVNVDFPAWMVAALDREARRVGVTRQSIIKMWVAERLEGLPANDGARKPGAAEK
jgi:hypothetical protein